MNFVGIGYDVHQLVAGRKLFLGGVEIPHTKGLDGHSDADALMHAICDAVLGALGGAGVARGVNVARGRTEASLRWDDAFLEALVVSALLRYLAVAHCGRGRGRWQEGEYPSFWRERVTHAVAAQRSDLAAIWTLRTTDGKKNRLIELRLRDILGKIARTLLNELYPGVLGELVPSRPR